MGGNNRQKKSGFNPFNMFKSRRPRRSEDVGIGNIGTGEKIWHSDGDKGSYVADPDINRKADKLIANFHSVRLSESERLYQTAASGIA